MSWAHFVLLKQMLCLDHSILSVRYFRIHLNWQTMLTPSVCPNIKRTLMTDKNALLRYNNAYVSGIGKDSYPSPNLPLEFCDFFNGGPGLDH